jgi:hypothetical protein
MILRFEVHINNASLDVNHSPAVRRLYIGKREQVAIFGVNRGGFSFNYLNSLTH